MSLRDGLTVRRLGGLIGAEIQGIDLSRELDAAAVAEIRAALLAHKVVFFRGQHDLDDEGQTRFAARFGQVTATAHPLSPGLAGRPQISAMDSGAKKIKSNTWHTDTTYVEQPPLGAVLRAVVVPPYGGDTLWANTARAYADLPEPFREYLDRLWGIHSNRWDYGTVRSTDGQHLPVPGNDAAAAAFDGPPFETEHPLVRVHPETGERSIVAGSHLRHILGLTAWASGDLQRSLQDHITRPENTIRWRWQPGDVVFWDNRSTQHYAAYDYDHRRVMHRVALTGEPLVGVTGEHSRPLVGDLTAYIPKAAAS